MNQVYLSNHPNQDRQGDPKFIFDENLCEFCEDFFHTGSPAKPLLPTSPGIPERPMSPGGPISP
jgi:hypothetical protein